jgi:hypothetical protein
LLFSWFLEEIGICDFFYSIPHSKNYKKHEKTPEFKKLKNFAFFLFFGINFQFSQPREEIETRSFLYSIPHVKIFEAASAPSNLKN